MSKVSLTIDREQYQKLSASIRKVMLQECLVCIERELESGIYPSDGRDVTLTTDPTRDGDLSHVFFWKSDASPTE